VSWFAHHVNRLGCPASYSLCRTVAELLSHTYAVALCFILILVATKAQQMTEIMQRFKAAIELLADSGGKAKKD
jgi:hypothetical protein